MSLKHWMSLAGALATATTVVVLAPFQHTVAQEPITLALCETDTTTVRVYTHNGQTLMRVYDRINNQVWMDQTPASKQTTPEGAQYANLQGEQSVILSVINRDANDCAIQVDSGLAINGSLLQSAAMVVGAVTYRQRIALPTNAKLVVKLEDVSLADAPSITIAEETIIINERQVPIPFTLAYNTAEIVSRNRYSVRAQIFYGDQLRWTSTTAYPVITQNNPTEVEIQLEQIEGR